MLASSLISPWRNKDPRAVKDGAQMEYVYIPPPLPTFGRWCALRQKFPDESVLRTLEYERLETANIHGRVLDIGGGRKACTKPFFEQVDELDSVNIDPEIEPTYHVEPDAPFPVEDGIYDVVVCLNTLEHIYSAEFVLQEAFRVLKPNGVIFISVPFIFRIHAHPDDFFRGTPSWWKETMRRAGFSRMEIQPLIWGRYTTAGMISGYRGLLPATLQRECSYLKDLLYAVLVFRGVDRYEGRRGKRICAVSPGWFITATK